MKKKPRNLENNDPLYAPGLKRRARKTGPNRRIWLPRPADIKAGYLPKSMPIPEDASDEEAAAICCKLQEGLKLWRKTGTTIVSPNKGTWAHVIAEYKFKENSPYDGLSDRTRKDYDGYMKSIEAMIGKRLVSSTCGDDLWRWYKKWTKCPDHLSIPKAEKAGIDLKFVQAKHHLGMIRRLARMAVLLGLKDCNHIEELFEGLRSRMRGAKSRSDYPTWEQVQDLIEKADAANRWSIGTATLMQFELGQRQGDIIGRWSDIPEGYKGGIHDRGTMWTDGVTWGDIDDSWTITISQNKSNGEIVLPFHLRETPHLFGRLQGVPLDKRVGPIIVSETTGRPYRGSNFSTVFRKIANDAQWPKELWNMDSKAGAATEATDAGASTKEVQSLTGHKTEQMANRYARITEKKRSKVTMLRQESRKNQKGND